MATGGGLTGPPPRSCSSYLLCAAWPRRRRQPTSRQIVVRPAAMSKATAYRRAPPRRPRAPALQGRLLMKLQARDRTQLVVIAYESGLVTPGGG